MGTLHYLIKLDKYEYFDLGKAFGYPFYDHVNDKPFLLPDIWKTPTELGLAIENRIKTGHFDKDYQKNAFVESQRLANLIHGWAKYDRLILRSDNSVDGIEYALKEFDAFTFGEWWEPYDNKRSYEERQRWTETGSVYLPRVSVVKETHMAEDGDIYDYKVVCDQSPIDDVAAAESEEPSILQQALDQHNSGEEE